MLIKSCFAWKSASSLDNCAINCDQIVVYSGYTKTTLAHLHQIYGFPCHPKANSYTHKALLYPYEASFSSKFVIFRCKKVILRIADNPETFELTNRPWVRNYTEISLRSKLLPEYHNWLRQAQPTSPELVEGDTRQQRLWCEGQKVLFSFCSQYSLTLRHIVNLSSFYR